MLYLAGQQEDVLFEIIILYICIFDLTTAICRLKGGFCWYIVYLKGMWYFVQAWLFFARRLRCDLLLYCGFAGSRLATCCFDQIFDIFTITSVKDDDAHIWFELYYFPFFVEMQAVVAARGVYMFDSSGTSVFKMRGQYICFDNEGTPCIPFCTFHPTGTQFFASLASVR